MFFEGSGSNAVPMICTNDELQLLDIMKTDGFHGVILYANDEYSMQSCNV